MKRMWLRSTGTLPARITVYGHGSLLLMSPFSPTTLVNQDQQVLVQLQRDDAPACWETKFNLPVLRKPSVKRFNDYCSLTSVKQGPCPP